MILYPAIDLKGGKCVRLLRGEMAQATVFSEDPAAQARGFAAKGCEWLHVVDLDGAAAGKPVNGAAIEEAAREAGFRVLNLDVRETQTPAIAMYEARGFVRWGTHPHYALVDGAFIAGHFYTKDL